MDRKIMLIVAVIFVIAMILAFYKFSTCSFSCAMNGYANSACRTAAVIPGAHPCNADEADIGETTDCTPGGLEGTMYHCCCS